MGLSAVFSECNSIMPAVPIAESTFHFDIS